jgi:hypothetical protein
MKRLILAPTGVTFRITRSGIRDYEIARVSRYLDISLLFVPI